jgi:hypothetical protein
MLRSSPTPEGRCCPIQPTAGHRVLAMVTHNRSRANPEVVLDQLIS